MYGKLFESMYEGTLGDNWRALVTFQQMIVLCDADGIIDMTPAAISRRTGIPIEIIKAGIKILEADDPHSRTPDENGKRIKRLDDHRDWGWFLVNHKQYRDKGDIEKIRKQNRERQRRRREKQSMSRDSRDGHAKSRHTNTDTDKQHNIPYRDIVSHLNNKSNKKFKPTTKETKRAIRARWNEGFRLNDFIQVIDNKCSKWSTDPKMVDYLRPQTLFGTKFEAYLNESGVRKRKLVGVDPKGSYNPDDN